MRPGRLVAERFRIEQLARSGGMGEIHLARDESTGQRVAVKVLTAPEPALTDRFEQEARVLAKLQHPAIVQYLAHGREEGGLYIAMEWLEGEDLAARLERGPLSVAEALMVASRVALALAWAHARGVVHRDIKPSNIFLPGGRTEHLKVLDFGVARLAEEAAVVTGTGLIMGTPAYMAPEQARGAKDAAAQADVFALGCVTFECLTGRRAFLGEQALAIFAKILLEEVPHVSEFLGTTVPHALDELVARMLSKDAALRPQNGAEVLDPLEQIRAAGSVVAGTQPPTRLSPREQRLVSVVLARSAVPRPLQAAPPSTTMPSGNLAARQGPLRAVVAPFGGQIEWLANGSLAVALSVSGSAPDQAVHAARCALALRAAGIDSPMVIATGQGVDLGARLPVGDVIDRAVRLLDGSDATGDDPRSSQPAAPPGRPRRRDGRAPRSALRDRAAAGGRGLRAAPRTRARGGSHGPRQADTVRRP